MEKTDSFTSIMTKKILLLLCLVFCFGCSKTRPASKENQKPLILTSIAPYQFLVERIAGPEFEVKTIAPSNANPHAFEPTSSQVAGMSRALAWFRIGEPFEEKILPFFTEKLKVSDLRAGIPLLKSETSCKSCSLDHQDRHIWLSPKRASLQAAAIEKTLSEQFPNKKESFQKNLILLQGQLALLDIEIETLLEPVKDRVLLVSHPAFGYFCEDYNFVQLSVEFEGKDPRPRHLEEILKKALSQHAEIALALPQYNNKGTEIIAEKLSVPIYMIDPYSSDYFKTMRTLAHLASQPSKEEPKKPL